MRPPDCPRLAKNPETDNGVTIFRHDDIVQFFWRWLFLLSSLDTGPSFMSISSLVLELWQFSFIRDWPEIRKSEIPTSEFFPISGDWGEFWIPNLARMSLIECYCMLQNSRATAFTVFELLRENQLGEGVKLPCPPPRLGLKAMLNSIDLYKGIFLHVIPVRIIVPCLTWILISQENHGKTQNISKLSVS